MFCAALFDMISYRRTFGRRKFREGTKNRRRKGDAAMRKKNRTSTLRRILTNLVYAAALAAGGFFSVRGIWSEAPSPSPSPPGPLPFLDPAFPIPAPTDTLAPPHSIGTDTDRKPVSSPAAQTAAGPAAGNRAHGSGRPRSAPVRESAPADLSAYRPQARSDRGETQ